MKRSYEETLLKDKKSQIDNECLIEDYYKKKEGQASKVLWKKI